MHSVVTSIGHSLDRSELDKKSSNPYLPIYTTLSEFYNDKKSPGLDNIGIESHVFTDEGIVDSEPSSFHPLSPSDCERVYKHIEYKYKVFYQNFTKSGNHDHFESFIQGQPWIFFYHLKLRECGTDMEDMAVTEPPENLLFFELQGYYGC